MKLLMWYILVSTKVEKILPFLMLVIAMPSMAQSLSKNSLITQAAPDKNYYHTYDTIFTNRHVPILSKIKDPYGGTIDSTVYNSEGKPIVKFEEDPFISDVHFRWKHSYSYHKNGITIEDFYDLDILRYKNISHHDKKGNIIQESVYIDDLLEMRIIRIYDKANNIIEVSQIQNNGSQKLISNYNRKGNVTEATLYYLKSKDLHEKPSLKHIENGEFIEPIYDFEEEFMGEYLFQYNKKQQLILRTFLSASGDLKGKNIFKYNKNGDLVEEITYDANNRFKTKRAYKYDEQKNIIEDSRIDSNGIVTYKKAFKFDDKGNTVYNGTLYKNKGLEWETSKFDEKGNEIENIICTSKDTIKDTYKFDKNGRKMESVHSFSERNGKNTTTRIYDDNGNEHVCQVYQSYFDDFTLKETSIIDKNGNELEEVKYDSDGNVEWKKTYKRDENDRPIEEIEYDTLGLKKKETYKWNVNGELIERREYNSKGLQKEISYTSNQIGELKEEKEYDLQGRLISMTRFQSGKEGYLLWEEVYYYNEKGEETHYAKYDNISDGEE